MPNKMLSGWVPEDLFYRFAEYAARKRARKQDLIALFIEQGMANNPISGSFTSAEAVEVARKIAFERPKTREEVLDEGLTELEKLADVAIAEKTAKENANGEGK